MARQDRTTARGIVRLGSRASSPSGAAASKPMMPNTAYRTPGITEPQPLALPVCAAKTDSVLCGPAATMSVIARTRKTSSSNEPRSISTARPSSTASGVLPPA
jgi:hypothetical protein